MSRVGANQVQGLMGAYQAVYDPDLRFQLEEEGEIEKVGIQIIENAAYTLFSQGYNVNDLIDYFTEAHTDVIVEDAIAISEGILLVENIGVSDEYIEEQFEILYEGILDSTLKFGGRFIRGAGKAIVGGGKRVEAIGRARNIQNIRAAKPTPTPKNYDSPLSRALGASPKTSPTPLPTTKPNILQRGADWAKTQLGKLPGAKAVQTLAKTPVGRFATKIGGRAIPIAGAAFYGMDAANRFKKGDWGGGLLSGAGAVTSLIPGAGLVTGLVPAGIQMATDAMGLTGDKSLKPKGGKQAPSPGAPKPKGGAGMVNVPGKGKRYFASSDRKYYKNYNDALAARRSRRGEVASAPSTPSGGGRAPSTPAAPSTPSGGDRAPSTPAAPSTPSGGGRAPSTPSGGGRAPSTPAATGGQSTDMNANYRAWAKANPSLAGRVKPGQAGYEAINKPSSSTSAPEVAVTNAAASNPNTGITAIRPPGTPPTPTEASTSDEERRKRERAAAATTTTESYEPFDLVLEYLFSEGHVDTLDEALYVMMEMDSETIQGICEMYGLEEWYKGRHGQSEEEHMASRSRGGKMVSGDRKQSGASFSHRSFRGVGGPARPGERQKHQGRMDNATRDEIRYRRALLKTS